jgi:hypothetical protein
LARRVFLELVHLDPKGGPGNVTRQIRSRSYLEQLDPALWPLAQKLAAEQHRLLVIARDETIADDTCDITHETLFRRWDKLRRWIEDEQELLLFRQRLDERIADFESSKGDPGYYLPKLELARAQNSLDRCPEAFEGRRAEFVRASARHWLEDRADYEARELWGKLELLSNWDPQEHDRAALAALLKAGIETRQRFLALATTNSAAARKFNRQPGIVIRAALGLDARTASECAAPALATELNDQSFEIRFAWTLIAQQIHPLYKIDWEHFLEESLILFVKTDDFEQMNKIAQLMINYADKANKTVARSIIDHLLMPDFSLRAMNRFESSIKVITALGKQLDLDELKEILLRLIDLSSGHESENSLSIFSEPFYEFADFIDQEVAKFIFESIKKQLKHSSYDQKAIFATIVHCLANMLESEKIGHFLAAIMKEQLDCISPDDRRLLDKLYQSLCATVEAAFERVDGSSKRQAVEFFLRFFCLLDDADAIRNHRAAVRNMAQTLKFILKDIEEKESQDWAQHIFVFAQRFDDQDILEVFSQCIGILAQKLNGFSAGQLCEMALSHVYALLNKDNSSNGSPISSFTFVFYAAAISSLGPKLESDVAARVLQKILAQMEVIPGESLSLMWACLAAALRETARDQTPSEAESSIVNRVFGKFLQTKRAGRAEPFVEPIAICCEILKGEEVQVLWRKAIEHAFDRAMREEKFRDIAPWAKIIFHIGKQPGINFPGEYTTAINSQILSFLATGLDEYDHFAMAEFVTQLADFLDDTTAAGSAIELISSTLQLGRMPVIGDHAVTSGHRFWLNKVIEVLQPLLPKVPVLLAAIESLKDPLGGDEKATVCLLRTITSALDRPDLLSRFPERSFWAVMQHLAELKAANPDWNWLDLARPPLSPEKLIAEFRRLCADPPHLARRPAGLTGTINPLQRKDPVGPRGG